MINLVFTITLPPDEEVTVTEKIAQGLYLYELQFRSDLAELTIFRAPNRDWWENGVGYSGLATLAGAAIQSYKQNCS